MAEGCGQRDPWKCAAETVDLRGEHPIELIVAFGCCLTDPVVEISIEGRQRNDRCRHHCLLLDKDSCASSCEV